MNQSSSAIAELRNKFDKMNVEQDYANIVPFWKESFKRLKENVKNSDPNDFLNWDIILKTMVIGNASFVKEELDFLKGLQDWDSRWKYALVEDSVGSPELYPAYRQSSGNLIHHAYHVAQLETQFKRKVNDFSFIFEFGGGYGSFCRLCYKLGFKGKYVIFDLKPFTFLQEYFLRSIGIDAISNTDPKQFNSQVLCISDLCQLKIIIEMLKKNESLFVATWSLSESPVSLREKIAEYIKLFDYQLIAYQGLFESIDNTQYFKEWSEKFNELEWFGRKIDFIPNKRFKDNYYLLGGRP